MPTAPHGPQTDGGIIARIVVQRYETTPEAVTHTLIEAFEERWPADLLAWLTITPGGLVSHHFAGEPWLHPRGWPTRPRDFQAAFLRLKPPIQQVLTPALLRAARRRTRWLTLGVDGSWHDRAGSHVEMVALINTRDGAIVGITGKSYPAADQENSLIHAPLSSQFVTLDRRRTLILGCHDLNMYSPRGNSNQRPGGPRNLHCQQFQRRCRAFKPQVIIHHPHSTDSPNMWRGAWRAIRADLPSLEQWASAIAFTRPEGVRGALHDVLSSTRSDTGIVDILTP